MHKLISVSLAVVLIFAAERLRAVDAAKPEIWMFAGPHVEHQFPGWENVRRDMGEMWQPDASWAVVSRSVSVIQFPPTSTSRATNQDLRNALANINRRHIAFAIGTGLLIRTDGRFRKTEAYVDQSELESLLGKLQRDGADVKYVTMDEPYFYGHVYSGPGAPHQSAQAIAEALLPGIGLVRKYFPHAQIGTDEVVNDRRSLVDELANWAMVYERVTGEKLAYLHADVSWNRASMQKLLPLSKALRARGVPFGISYNAAARGYEHWFDANSVSRSDAGWVRDAVQHFTEVEAGLGLRPDHAVLTTWVHFPTHMLPETDPRSFTNLVYQYIQRRQKE